MGRGGRSASDREGAPAHRHQGQDLDADPRGGRALLAAIPTDGDLVGLRDQALIGTLLYSFARISAALAMRVEDYYPIGRRWWLRLHEKGSKHHEMPVHHTLQDALDAYLNAAGLAQDRKGPLFRSARGRTGRLTGQAITRTGLPPWEWRVR